MFIEKDDVAMDLMTAGESGSGLGSILDFCAGAAALLLGFVIAAALPPVTLAVLRKKYNQADGTQSFPRRKRLYYLWHAVNRIRYVHGNYYQVQILHI